MKGRKPKPTHLKVVAGNPGKRPLNDREPQFTLARITPPRHLSKTARAEWRRVLKELQVQGVVTVVDRAALAAYCQAYARWADAEDAFAAMQTEAAKKGDLSKALLVKTKTGNYIQNPLVGACNRAMELMLRAAVEIGMTPSARSRIVQTPGVRRPHNPFENNGRRAGS